MEGLLHFVTQQLGAHLAVAVLHEVVQGQRTSVLFTLVVAVAWQVVLAGDVVALKPPLILDLIHGDHAFSRIHPAGSPVSFTMSMSRVALMVSSVESGFPEYGVSLGSAGRWGP